MTQSIGKRRFGGLKLNAIHMESQQSILNLVKKLLNI